MNTEKREKARIKEDKIRKIKMKYYNIKVNLTEQDLCRLKSGNFYFNWTFDSEEDENIKINVVLTTGEDKEEE